MRYKKRKGILSRRFGDAGGFNVYRHMPPTPQIAKHFKIFFEAVLVVGCGGNHWKCLHKGHAKYDKHLKQKNNREGQTTF